MFSRRDLELLDVVGEVMRERLGEVRKNYEEQLAEIKETVGNLASRDHGAALDGLFDRACAYTEDRVEALTKSLAPPPAPEPPDLSPILERLAALEARPIVDEMEVLRSTHNLETVHTRLLALEDVKPPAVTEPPDLSPIFERLSALEQQTLPPDLSPDARKAELDSAITAAKAYTDERVLDADERRLELQTAGTDALVRVETRTKEAFDEITNRIKALEARPVVDAERAELDHAAIDDLRGVILDVSTRSYATPADLAPIATKLAELETRPTADEVRQLATSAFDVIRSGIIERLDQRIDARFDALPIPEKGDPGPGVTADDFRPLFEAEYAKFALDTERRIMDLVQRTLDRVPVPEDGKDGVGFTDLNIVRDGRTVRHEYLRDGEVVKTFEFKTDELIYRGIYRARTPYEKGDVVTWDGKLWIARADTTTAPVMNGGEADAWLLAVKDGRRGRSAYEVAVARGFVGTEEAWLASLKGKPGEPAKPAPPDGKKWKGSATP